MFCKWCGGTLSPSDTKCKRCGKEVPALSDCGGFYDLVHDVEKIDDSPQVEIVLPESKTMNERNPLAIIPWIISGVVIIVLLIAVLLIVISQMRMSYSESNCISDSYPASAEQSVFDETIKEMSIEEIQFNNESSLDEPTHYQESIIGG